MLVLRRKSGQGIWIGDNVHIIVSKFSRGYVSLVIDAPSNVIVDRDEVKTLKTKDTTF